MAKASSAHIWYILGLVVESKSRDSWYPTKMLASTGPSGLPIAMPSVCLFMVLLKLNSTEDVAVFNKNVLRKINGDEFAIVKRVGVNLYRFG